MRLLGTPEYVFFETLNRKIFRRKYVRSYKILKSHVNKKSRVQENFDHNLHVRNMAVKNSCIGTYIKTLEGK